MTIKPKMFEDAKEHNDEVFPPGQTLHIALADQGFVAYLLDFCLVQQFYDLTIDRLSGKKCTFAHVTRVFFATSKVTKEAEILQEGFSLIFRRVKLLPDSNIDKTKASVSKLSFDTDANYFVLFSKQNLPQVISALEKTKV